MIGIGVVGSGNPDQGRLHDIAETPIATTAGLRDRPARTGVDAVAIAPPASTPVGPAREAPSAGRPILVAKPPAPSTEASLRLVDAGGRLRPGRGT